MEPSDKTVPIDIKTEFTKINKCPKQSCNESYIVKVLRENMAKYSHNINSTSSIKEGLKEAKSVDIMDNFEIDNNLAIVAPKSKSESYKKKPKVKIKIEHPYSEPETKTMKTDGFDSSKEEMRPKTVGG